MADIDKVLQAIPPVIRNGNGDSWQCRCPAHKDAKPSLTITYARKEDKILFTCHAGCTLQKILSAAGLEMTDIMDASTSLKKKQRYSVYDRMIYGMQQNDPRMKQAADLHFAAEYPYTDAAGTYLFSKVRFEYTKPDGTKSKEIRYYQISGENYKTGKGSSSAAMYNLPSALDAIKKNVPVYIVEGEKDVETLKKIRLPAVTMGSASDWKSCFAPYFKGASVIILPDNDSSGETAVKRIIADLKKYAFRYKVVKTSEKEKGDVTDYLEEAGHDQRSLKDLIDSTEWIFPPWLNKGKINPGIFAECFARNEHFFFSKDISGSAATIYFYEHGVYKEINKTNLKRRIREYIPSAYITRNQQDGIYELIITDPNSVERSVAEMNRDEDIINLKNGIYRISAASLEDHSPDHISTRQLDIIYDDSKKACPVFMRYIQDLCRDEAGQIKQDQLDLLQEVIGLVLSNVYGFRTKKAAFLYSARGNSGKTQLIRFLQEVMDEKQTAVIPLVAMNERWNRFSLSQLTDVRMITSGDQTAATVEDSSIFKSLTGGDTVKVEAKGKNAFQMLFRGVLIYACNGLPDFADDKGEHLFRRLLIIPCVHTIGEDTRDTGILKKMLQEKSAVFNWAMEGLQRLKQNNYRFSECQAAKAVTEEYRNKVDTLFAFLNESGFVKTKNDKDVYAKNLLYDSYTKWCEENDLKPIKKRYLKWRMEKLGFPEKKANIAYQRGIICYAFIQAKDNSKFVDAEETPFD